MKKDLDPELAEVVWKHPQTSIKSQTPIYILVLPWFPESPQRHLIIFCHLAMFTRHPCQHVPCKRLTVNLPNFFIWGHFRRRARTLLNVKLDLFVEGRERDVCCTHLFSRGRSSRRLEEKKTEETKNNDGKKRTSMGGQQTGQG